MIFESLPHLRYAQADEFSHSKNGSCHCKTVPFYIFAQAFEGHYELDADGEFAVCEEGGAFFVPPNIPLKIWHYVNPESGIMRIRFVHFIPEDPRGLDPFSQYRLRLAVSRADCREPATIIKRLLKSGPDRSRFLLASDFLRLLALFQSFMKPKKAAPYPESLSVLLQWIQKHAGEPIHTSDLEKIFPLSRSKMFSLFHDATGMSPGSCILRERIRFAARLMLCNPNLSVKEAADQCGWQTACHFSRMFRQVMGEPPGRYVRKAAVGAGPEGGKIKPSGGQSANTGKRRRISRMRFRA